MARLLLPALTAAGTQSKSANAIKGVLDMVDLRYTSGCRSTDPHADPRAEVAVLMPEVSSGMDTKSSQLLAVEQVWAEALPRLVRYVRRLGASEEDAHDIAQETATRAIHARLNYGDVEDLLRWCQVVAKRQVIDGYRRRQSRETTCEPSLAGVPQGPDSAQIVHESIHLSHTLRAIAQLPPSERVAMLNVIDDVDAPSCRQKQLSEASARRRARQRLQQTVGYPWSVAALLAGLRRHLRPGPVLASALPAVLAGLVLLPAIGARTPGQGLQSVPAPMIVWHHAELARPLATSNRVGPVAGSTAAQSSHRPRGTTSSSSAHVISRVSGPLGASSTLQTEPNAPGRHLICLHGTIGPSFCVG